MKNIDKSNKLTKFEFMLWLTSVSVILLCHIISVNISILSTVASLIGVTALIFVAKGLVIGQVLTIIFSIFYGVISYHFQYYGEMITYLCMTSPIALITVFEWIRHPYKKTNIVEVSEVTKGKLIFMTISCAIVTSIFYIILKSLNTANIFFSTISVATSYIASFLTYCRNPGYALGYAANDIVLIILWISATLKDKSYLPMIICFFMFLINDLYGFFNWKRIQKNQNGD